MASDLLELCAGIALVALALGEPHRVKMAQRRHGGPVMDGARGEELLMDGVPVRHAPAVVGEVGAAALDAEEGEFFSVVVTQLIGAHRLGRASLLILAPAFAPAVEGDLRWADHLCMALGAAFAGIDELALAVDGRGWIVAVHPVSLLVIRQR